MPNRPHAPSATNRPRQMLILALVISFGAEALTDGAAATPQATSPADLVLLNGKIVCLDAAETQCTALAVRGGRIAALGSEKTVAPYVGPETKTIRLEGKTVTPGFIEAHVHALGAARTSLGLPYTELGSIAEIQAWIRDRAKETPPGAWIMVIRNDITRLAERRHPTPAELDAACTTHPVAFEAARRWVLNTRGFAAAGLDGDSPGVRGATILRDESGKPRMIAGADAHLRGLIGSPRPTDEQTLDAFGRLVQIYNSVGITSIYERALDRNGHRLFRTFLDRRPNVRVTFTLRGSMRSADDVRRFVSEMGFKPREGDEWLRAGPLKFFVDGGIHWGNTHLREPYGPRRAAFYVREDPNYQGALHCTVDQMREVFSPGHRLGWQMCVHVTGDAGMDRVLDALEAADRELPVAGRRFTLCHAYFPDEQIAARCRRLGVCVDTQPWLYYKDSEAIAEIYGPAWAERLIGLGQWLREGVRVGINSDHMIGLDPDRAMNAFNPALSLWIAVRRVNQQGRTYGPRQRISRLAALRMITSDAAWLGFNEDQVGSLEVGKCADLVVLDRDLLVCPEDDLRGIKVLTTIVGGRIVYQR